MVTFDGEFIHSGFDYPHGFGKDKIPILSRIDWHEGLYQTVYILMNIWYDSAHHMYKNPIFDRLLKINKEKTG